MGLGIAATHGWLITAKLLIESGALVNEPVSFYGDADRVTAISTAVKEKTSIWRFGCLAVWLTALKYR
jgi:hypothetical protein